VRTDPPAGGELGEAKSSIADELVEAKEVDGNAVLSLWKHREKKKIKSEFGLKISDYFP
jgi:hypothetical protein